jgi:phytoene desaturase
LGQWRFGSDERPVKRIIIENNAATGVELASGEIVKGDLVISNADPGITILKLSGEQHFPADYVKQVKALEYTLGSFSCGLP